MEMSTLSGVLYTAWIRLLQPRTFPTFPLILHSSGLLPLPLGSGAAPLGKQSPRGTEPAGTLLLNSALL